MRQGRSHSTEYVSKRRTFGRQSARQRFRTHAELCGNHVDARLAMRQERGDCIFYSDLKRAGLCMKANERLFRTAYAEPIEVGVGRYDRVVPTVRRKDDFIDVRPHLYFAVEQFFYVTTVLRPGVHDPDLHGFKVAVSDLSTDA